MHISCIRTVMGKLQSAGTGDRQCYHIKNTTTVIDERIYLFNVLTKGFHLTYVQANDIHITHTNTVSSKISYKPSFS